ncbi:MAG: hypothetical protein LBF97_05040, partial [Elusimicrobiota bacterium]|nr:hypothetical protein [Elusimicrobiota bacterium]
NSPETPYKNTNYNKETLASLIVNGGMSVNGTIFGHRSKNAIWNDYADFVEVEKDVEEIFGKVYVVNENGKAFIANKRAQKGAIGICSDTYGFITGENKKLNQIPIGIGGFVLALVDKIYLPGTELVSDKFGNLTKANLFEKIFKRESIIGTFYKKEEASEWNGVKVNNKNCRRHWVKVR